MTLKKLKSIGKILFMLFFPLFAANQSFAKPAYSEAAQSSDIAFYINAIHFDDVNGQIFCDLVFEIMAESNLPNPQAPDYPKWYFNDVEDPDYAGYPLNVLFYKLLMPGDYTVKMEYLDSDNNVGELVTTFTVSTPPSIGTFTIPELCNFGSFNPDSPTVTGGSVLSAEWQLESAVGSDAYQKIELPYTVSLSDAGKRIRYYVENACGTAYSTPQTLVVNQATIPSVKITVKVN